VLIGGAGVAGKATLSSFHGKFRAADRSRQLQQLPQRHLFHFFIIFLRTGLLQLKMRQEQTEAQKKILISFNPPASSLHLGPCK
jgi:hypothetical protein